MMANHREVADFLVAVRESVPDDAMRMCRGKVTAYDATSETVTVTLSGGSVECPGTHFFDHYSPTVGDEVHIVIVAEDKMVFGKIRRP